MDVFVLVIIAVAIFAVMSIVFALSSGTRSGDTQHKEGCRNRRKVEMVHEKDLERGPEGLIIGKPRYSAQMKLLLPKIRRPPQAHVWGT